MIKKFRQLNQLKQLSQLSQLSMHAFYLLVFLVSALGVSGLVSCGDDSSDSGEEALLQEVLSDPENVRYVWKQSTEIDQEARTLSWMEEQISCGVDNLANVQRVERTFRYTFQGSDLLLWEKGHCNAEVLEGGNSGQISGTWSFTGGLSTVPEDEGVDLTTCYGPSYKVVIEHESDTLKVDGNGNISWIQNRPAFCPAFSDSARLAVSFFNQGEIVPEGCAKVEIVSEDRTGVLTYMEYNKETMGVKRSFVFEADTCMWDETAEITDEFCTAHPGGVYTTFEECVRASGIFGQN